MQGYRAKLRAVPRRKKAKDGQTKKYWVARGFIPVRQPNGTFARRRVEIGIGGDTAAARQREIDRLNQAYEDAALNTPLTFARAYHNYISLGKPVPQFAEKILSLLGLRQCHDIDDSVMVDAQAEIFAKSAKPSYINRHLHTPVSAILRLALKEHAPRLTRPAGHKLSPEIQIPNLDWFRLVAPHMTAETVAIVWFLTIHGRRLGDALGREPKHFDPEAGTLLIGKSKTGEPIFIDLHPSVAAAFLRMKNWEKRRWLFRDGPRSGNNVRKDIMVAVLKANGLEPSLVKEPRKAREALKGAKVPYFATHAIGRHSAATRALMDGYSLLHVQRMFGWASIDMVAKRYGHLAKKETTAAVHKVGDTFLGRVSPDHGGKVGFLPPPTLSKSVKIRRKMKQNGMPK